MMWQRGDIVVVNAAPPAPLPATHEESSHSATAVSSSSSSSSSSSASSSSSSAAPRTPTPADHPPPAAALAPPSAGLATPAGGSLHPLLWRRGRAGGRAQVIMWAPCGGGRSSRSWNGGRVLDSVPWQTEEQDASILILPEEGSTGLDLSFSTHLFLLEKIKDPSLVKRLCIHSFHLALTRCFYVGKSNHQSRSPNGGFRSCHCLLAAN